jgi:hypothetical protein
MTRDQWMRLQRRAVDAGEEELGHEVAVEMANAERRRGAAGAICWRAR